MTYPSLTLKQLAAIIPSEHIVELLDERCKKIDFNKFYDLVGISCLTHNAPRAYEIADEFQKRGVTVILGGYHPTALPNEAKQHADAVVIGEAENILPQLLIDKERNELKPFYVSNKNVEPDEISPADHSIRFGASLIEPLQASRGCPNQCKFCAIKSIEGCRLRKRPIKDVIEEIKTIKKQRLFFIDASLTNSPQYAKSLFKEMKGINKKFVCCGNINVLSKDDEFLKLASEAGCDIIQVGFESISQQSIDNMNKKTNIVKDYAKVVKKIKDYNIMTMGLFMFGFDSDYPDVFDKTLKVINKWKIERGFFSILTPFPGTPIFEKMEKEGRILINDWSQYNPTKVVFQPKNMTTEELYLGTKKVVKEFHSLKNLLKSSFSEEKFNLNHFIGRSFRDFSSLRYYEILDNL